MTKELKQEDYQMTIIKDLGNIYATKTSKKKARFAIFKCTNCETCITSAVSDVKRSKRKYCIPCNKKHGMHDHRLYSTWQGQKKRCYNKNSKMYKHYGKRGIFMDIRFKTNFLTWLNYVQLLPNYNTAKYSLDRVNNNEGYVPMNLRWANQQTQSQNTQRIQTNNTSGFRGVSKHGQRTTKIWRSTITINNKHVHIGLYNTAIEAAVAYDPFVISQNTLEIKYFHKTL